MGFLICAPLQTNKQAETGGKATGRNSALSVISTGAAEELFPAETAFQEETNYHISVCWEAWGTQKQAELVGKRRKVRKSKLLSIGERFVWASQPVRYYLRVSQRPKNLVSREIRLFSGMSCLPRSCAQETRSFQKARCEALVGVSALPQLCPLWAVCPNPTCCPCYTQHEAPSLSLQPNTRGLLQGNQRFCCFWCLSVSSSWCCTAPYLRCFQPNEVMVKIV